MSKSIFITTFFLLYILISCSTNQELIKKGKTEFGKSKYYIVKGLKNSYHKERFLVIIDNSVYFSFYPDKIVKQTKKYKKLIFTLSFDNTPENVNEAKYYQHLTKIDSIVLAESGKLLDSLNLQNFKKWNGEKTFIAEVNYFHGYPQNKKFKSY